MEQPSLPNPVQLAEFAVNITRDVAGIELDYSRASLDHVEALIEGFRAEGLTAEIMNETIFMFGCYLGEVMIRKNGGQWKVAAETPFKSVASPDLLVLETPNGVWNPIGKVFKQLENGPDDSITFFFDATTCDFSQLDRQSGQPKPA